MLLIREAAGPEEWREVQPDTVVGGLREDTNYLLALPGTGTQRVFVDDEELPRTFKQEFPWRPALYAGRVGVQVLEASGELRNYSLDVSPNPEKSGEAHFAEMIECIRTFDASLLIGESAATRDFGREHTGEYAKQTLANDIALSRLRQHGPSFLQAVEAIARLPHRSLVAEMAVLPLSRIRKLHPSALRDRRVAEIARGTSRLDGDFHAIQLRSHTSAPTFDTPANRAVLSLLKRFRARVVYLREQVRTLKLGWDVQLQATRIERRLEVLDALEMRANRLLRSAPFTEVTKSETSAASLTQIAALPLYSKAHRSGIGALAAGLEGDNTADRLHVPPSWGIYEFWCYLSVVELVRAMVPTVEFFQVPPSAASGKLAYGATLTDGSMLEILFQATFRAGQPASMHRCAWSISGEREPDIVLVHHQAGGARAMILDAKWRAGRSNVLDAMASAHIYHDALRVGAGARPSPCLLLLPGATSVGTLEESEFIRRHKVGAIGNFSVAGQGRAVLEGYVRAWLDDFILAASSGQAV